MANARVKSKLGNNNYFKVHVPLSSVALSTDPNDFDREGAPMIVDEGEVFLFVFLLRQIML